MVNEVCSDGMRIRLSFALEVMRTPRKFELCVSRLIGRKVVAFVKSDDAWLRRGGVHLNWVVIGESSRSGDFFAVSRLIGRLVKVV